MTENSSKKIILIVLVEFYQCWNNGEDCDKYHVCQWMTKREPFGGGTIQWKMGQSKPRSQKEKKISGKWARLIRLFSRVGSAALQSRSQNFLRLVKLIREASLAPRTQTCCSEVSTKYFCIHPLFSLVSWLSKLGSMFSRWETVWECSRRCWRGKMVHSDWSLQSASPIVDHPLNRPFFFNLLKLMVKVKVWLWLGWAKSRFGKSKMFALFQEVWGKGSKRGAWLFDSCT